MAHIENFAVTVRRVAIPGSNFDVAPSIRRSGNTLDVTGTLTVNGEAVRFAGDGGGRRLQASQERLRQKYEALKAKYEEARVHRGSML